MKKRILILVTALFVSVFVLSGCNKKDQPEMGVAEPGIAGMDAGQGGTAEGGISKAEDFPIIELTAETDGQTAYELLKEDHEPEVKEYDFGVYIEGIDGVKGNDQYYWAFYLDGEYADKGADQTVLKVGDKVEFRYEEIKF